jgi:hypothetical protein
VAQQAESSASRQRSDHGGQEHRPHTARTRLLLSIESAGRGAEPLHRRLGAASGPTAICETPSRPDDGLRASTTTTTTARATMMIEDVGGAMIATTTATVDFR